jgi:hypothetical protein
LVLATLARSLAQNRVVDDMAQSRADSERRRLDLPTVAVTADPVFTPRLNEDPDVPIVVGEEITGDASGFLPPLAPRRVTDSPSQQIAVALKDKRLEPCIWLSLARAVAERPSAAGWYVGADPNEVLEDGPNEDYTVEWQRLPFQDQIDAAWFDETQTSVMLYGREKGDDIKIDLKKMYAKGRSGIRRPVV